MRHLYAAAAEPGVSYLIDKAKTYERRRCGHHPDDHPTPLSTKECLASVVDPNGSKTNKHRYVVASQEQEVRKLMRGILGVPLSNQPFSLFPLLEFAMLRLPKSVASSRLLLFTRNMVLIRCSIYQ
jgi:Fcf1